MISISAGAKNKVTLSKINNLLTDLQAGIRKGLQQSGVDIAGKAGATNDGLIKQDMNSPKHGRTYEVSRGRGGRALKRVRTHIASAAGEAPAVITGKLRQSVYFKVQGSNQLRIGADTPYAGFLEKGTSKMAPRPYLKNNIDKSRQNIEKNIIQAINAQLK